MHRILASILFLGLVVSAAALPCRSCGRELEGDYFEFIDEAVGGKVNICRECSTNAPKCFYCNVPFKTGLRTTDDGRQVCERDASDGLDDGRELVVIGHEVRGRLNELFRGQMVFPEATFVMSRSSKELSALHQNPRGGGPPVGLTRSVSRVPGRFDHTILILSGMRRSRAMAICAHEFTHAWMAEQVGTRPALDGPAIEGFCELVALKFMETAGAPWEVEYIKLNRYTEGQLSALRELESAEGFGAVLAWVRAGKEKHLTQAGADSMPRPAVAPVVSVGLPQVPEKLTLRGITRGATRRFALINSKTMAVGETAVIGLGPTNVVVTCQEIGADYAVILSGTPPEKQRLTLAPEN